MNLLLDTHVFLWSLFTPEKLSQRARRTITSRQSDAGVSVVSFWEISLKYSLGKLELKGVGPEELRGFAEQMKLEPVPVTPAEAAGFHRLPKIARKDPFDRMIVWQAIQRNMTLVSKDRDLRAYREFGLKTLW